MKQRIWELDALRGLCILGMVLVHLSYDLTYLFHLFPEPTVFVFLQRWGGILFLLISGICVTLGSHPIRRGLLVFGCGLICTAATAGMYLLGFADSSILIYFGVLHCLGICMLLWPLMKKLPLWALGVLGFLLAAIGLHLSQTIYVDFPYLIPLGLYPKTFASSDYFPLLPNLGFFLLGAFLGKTLYRNQKTLFPKTNPNHPLFSFLRWWGTWSLPIYLLHQPVLTGLVYLILCLR